MGYGGLLPFAALGLVAWLLDGPRQALAIFALLAWLALLCGAGAGLIIVAAGLWACWAVDRTIYPRFGLQGWLAMRLRLTAIASLSCVAVALATFR